MPDFFKKVHATQIVMVIFLFMLCSCATVLEQTPNNFLPTQNQSIIFGKSEFILNGKLLPYDGKSYFSKKSITHHIGKYNNKNNLNTNAFISGDYSFRVTYDDKGYFVYSLPPGIYYFVEFVYYSILPDSVNNNVGIRTYADIPNTTTKRPYLITFEVPPNSATYIGTIRHNFDTIQSNILFSTHTYNIDIKDEYEEAQKWILLSRNGFKEYMSKRLAVLDYSIH